MTRQFQDISAENAQTISFIVGWRKMTAGLDRAACDALRQRMAHDTAFFETERAAYREAKKVAAGLAANPEQPTDARSREARPRTSFQRG